MPLDEKHEGLVLRSLDYKDREKIITLFTPKRGMISLIVKGITRKKTHLLTLTSPFTRAEYLFRIHHSLLYTFKDGTPINTHNALRNNLSHIQTATLFARALLSSQLPEKPAPALYQLTLTYLKHLPDFSDPSSLSASFLLKLLKHEGHLSLSPTCAHCKSPATHLHLGEALCKQHTHALATHFTDLEWPILMTLLDTRSIPELQKTHVSSQLQGKIEKIFKYQLAT